MKNYKLFSVLILFLSVLTACTASAAGNLTSRTGIEYSEDKFNNLTDVNAVVYHSDQCSLWIFGDETSAGLVNGSDFPGVTFSFKGQDIKTGKQVLLLADNSVASCVEPTLSGIFGRTLSASQENQDSYTTGDYEPNASESSSIYEDEVGENTDEAEKVPLVEDCGSGQVELEVKRIGKSSLLQVVLTSVSSVDCYVNVGPSETRLSISDGNSWLWSSDECLNNGTGSNKTLLKAGQSLMSASYEWDRSQSTGDGCSVSDTGNEVLPSGLYYFKANLNYLGISSSNKQFRF